MCFFVASMWTLVNNTFKSNKKSKSLLTVTKVEMELNTYQSQ